MNRSSYVFDCIAASGLAVMSPAIAYELRPDLWACVEDCARTLNTRAEVHGTQRLSVTFKGYGSALVFARSLDGIEKRLEWIVGQPVLALKAAEPEAPLAAEVPPSHDCSRRREILAARKELGMPAA